MLRGYVCPAGTPVNQHQRPGQQNRVEHCLSVCPHPCVTPPLLAAMWSAERKNPHQGTYLSASMLAGDGCARQTWFERQPDLDYFEVPRRRWWPFRGTIIHGLVEGASGLVLPYGWFSELRMEVPLTFPDLPAPLFEPVPVPANATDVTPARTEWRFTGEFDSMRPLVITIRGTTDAMNPITRMLHDFKTTGDIKFQEFLRGKQGGEYSSHIKDSWVWQVNIYRWLVSRTRITDAQRTALATLGHTFGEFFPAPERLSIQLISMMELARTGTDYVPMRTGATPLELPDVPVIPMDRVVEFVRDKALWWYRWLVLGEKPPVVAEHNAWMCKSCVFNGELSPNGPCFPNSER